MFWTGFIIGAFFGANIGVVVAGLLISARKNDTQEPLSKIPMDHAVMDEAREAQNELPSLHRPGTYLDGYPHS